jgi:hypothetical protein
MAVRGAMNLQHQGSIVGDWTSTASTPRRGRIRLLVGVAAANLGGQGDLFLIYKSGHLMKLICQKGKS